MLWCLQRCTCWLAGCLTMTYSGIPMLLPEPVHSVMPSCAEPLPNSAPEAAAAAVRAAAAMPAATAAAAAATATGQAAAATSAKSAASTPPGRQAGAKFRKRKRWAGAAAAPSTSAAPDQLASPKACTAGRCVAESLAAEDGHLATPSYPDAAPEVQIPVSCTTSDAEGSCDRAGEEAPGADGGGMGSCPPGLAASSIAEAAGGNGAEWGTWMLEEGLKKGAAALGVASAGVGRAEGTSGRHDARCACRRCIHRCVLS